MSTEAPRHVLVVCTANSCRSPMAEGPLKAAADCRGRPVAVKSGGVMELIGRPADPKAVKVCKELDIDLRAHRSQGIDAATVAWADHILVMELRHQIELHASPRAKARRCCWATSAACTRSTIPSGDGPFASAAAATACNAASRPSWTSCQ